MAKLTVLQVLPALVSGGVERGTVEIAAAIVRAGGTALVASAGGPMVRDVEAMGGEHVLLPLDTKSPYAIWRNARKIGEVIAARGVDVVHARSRAPAWSALRAARRAGVPFVTTFHGTYNYGNRAKKLYNSVMTRGDRVIAISRFIYAHVLEHYEVDEAVLRLVHRGVDTGLFDPAAVTAERIGRLAEEWGIRPDRPTILMPGRITRWKGQAVLLEALHRLGRRDVRCLVVGGTGRRDGYLRELQVMAAEKELGGIVHFVGSCRDMPAAYLLADVVVHASTDAEAFGRVVAEAQAMGRPVIATNIGGPPEIVPDGKTGWLVDPGDADALARALDHALALTPEERERMRDLAIAHIRRNFTVEAMCEATLAVYKEVRRG